MTCAVAAVLCLAAWQPHTAVMEGVADVLIAADGLQTAQLRRDGFYERESDCIIGHHPKASSVALYFTGLGVAHLLVANALENTSPRWADVFEGLSIGWEGSTVAANIKLGVSW